MNYPAETLPSPPLTHAIPQECVRFSIIIPLEFHRGQAQDCLDLWLAGQTHPREDFEIVLACPPDFPQSERKLIAAKLAPQDRLIEFPCAHDIALVEQGAKVARGDYFFFTESHVLPEPDTLARVAAAFMDHPEWAGFSLQSVPLTHNFLSQIEAEFYSPTIHQGLSSHAWCKVLDQCFAVRKEAYFQAIGFQAEYGHYSEWVLAARMHVLGLDVGYLQEAKINHFYIGELHDLEEFTADFAAGHWKWFMQSANDPTRPLMRHPDVYAQRFEALRPLAKPLAKLTRARRWRLAALFGLRGALWSARWKYHRAKLRLHWHCWRKDRAGLQALIDVNDSLVAITHLRELMQLPSPVAVPLAENGEWSAAVESEIPILGIYAKEEAGGKVFCWSEPAGLVQLALPPGRYEIELHWLPLRTDIISPSLFLNDQLVDSEKQTRFKFRARCKWRQKNAAPLQLAWLCPAFSAEGETRSLAVPLTHITWKRLPEEN